MPSVHNQLLPPNLLGVHMLVVAVQVEGSAATSSRRSKRSKTRSWARAMSRNTFPFVGLSHRLNRTILPIPLVAETDATRRSTPRVMDGTARSAVRVGTSLNTGKSRLFSSSRFFSESNFCRYLLGMQVADWTTQAWLQGFNDVGAQIIGKTADELMALQEVRLQWSHFTEAYHSFSRREMRIHSPRSLALQTRGFGILPAVRSRTPIM